LWRQPSDRPDIAKLMPHRTVVMPFDEGCFLHSMLAVRQITLVRWATIDWSWDPEKGIENFHPLTSINA
jgi:hypothetical protein